MVSYASNAPEWDCISTDIITKDGKIITNDETVNRKLKNGHRVYLMDTQDVYLYDEENETLRKQT